MIDNAQAERHLRVIETIREEPRDEPVPISRPAQIHELQQATSATFGALEAHAGIADSQEKAILSLLARVHRLENENRALWGMLVLLSMVVMLLTLSLALS